MCWIFIAHIHTSTINKFVFDISHNKTCTRTHVASCSSQQIELRSQADNMQVLRLVLYIDVAFYWVTALWFKLHNINKSYVFIYKIHVCLKYFNFKCCKIYLKYNFYLLQVNFNRNYGQMDDERILMKSKWIITWTY